MNATHRKTALVLAFVIILLALASMACNDIPSCNDIKCWDGNGPGCILCQQD
jgi:hypothetical protein